MKTKKAELPLHIAGSMSTYRAGVAQLPSAKPARSKWQCGDHQTVEGKIAPRGSRHIGGFQHGLTYSSQGIGDFFFDSPAHTQQGLGCCEQQWCGSSNNSSWTVNTQKGQQSNAYVWTGWYAALVASYRVPACSDNDLRNSGRRSGRRNTT